MTQGTRLKYDAGKAPVWQGLVRYFPRALRQVAEVSGFGYSKYQSWGGWRDVPDAFNRYSDGLLRHLLDEACGVESDAESKLLHAAHHAWNALGRLELLLLEREKARAPAASNTNCAWDLVSKTAGPGDTRVFHCSVCGEKFEGWNCRPLMCQAPSAAGPA